MKPKLIIVEGCQGVGKTSVTNILRDKMTYTNLIRLSGIKDITNVGCTKIHNVYLGLMHMLYSSSYSDMNYLFDRTFLSERVYCLCGYKQYDFEKEYRALMDKLSDLSSFFDIYVIILRANENTLRKRLKRDKPTFGKVDFSVSNSLKQQSKYIDLLIDLRYSYLSTIKCIDIPTDNSTSEEVAEIITKFVNEV